MPPISRNTPQRRQVSFAALVQLASGQWRSFLDESPAAPTVDELRQLSRQVGDELTVLHIAEHPGSRPWGWWPFEAPERRPRVDGETHPFEDGSIPAQHQRLDHGVPTFFQSDDHFTAWYESQAAYLQRLDLLTPAERPHSAQAASAWSLLCDEGQPALSNDAIRGWLGLS